MRTGHEKANHNDKAKKPDYWEDREAVRSYNPKTDFDPYEVRPLRVVMKWPLRRLLDEALIQECRSIADGHHRRLTQIAESGAKVYNPAIAQGACWVCDSLNHLSLAVKNFRAQRGQSSHGNSEVLNLSEMIEVGNQARSALGRLFPLREYDKMGIPPPSYTDSHHSQDPLNSTALAVLSEYFHLRNVMDFFLAYKIQDAKTTQTA